MEVFSLVVNSFRNVLDVILNNKTFSEIKQNDLINSKPEVSKSYNEAIESLLNGSKKKATVKINENESFDLHSTMCEN
tara:strand:- start:1540 stop:1773 length:234 start_codon:yes stop_codon:yes gene_type:complete